MKARDRVWRIFNGISLPILLIDRNYQVSDMNSAALSHLRLPREEILGSSCFKVTHGLEEPCWHSEEIVCPVKEAFETGKRVRAIHKHKIDDEVVVEETVATPLEEGDREIDYVIEEFRDVTELLDLRDGLLPICASCNKIRDLQGSWRHIETYIREHTGADFSHSFCPECILRLYPESNEGDDGH
jgi:transcriptional regulator with PAS, ATPase and Fis domain